MQPFDLDSIVDCRKHVVQPTGDPSLPLWVGSGRAPTSVIFRVVGELDVEDVHSAAVDEVFTAGEVCGVVGCKEHDDLRDVVDVGERPSGATFRPSSSRVAPAMRARSWPSRSWCRWDGSS